MLGTDGQVFPSEGFVAGSPSLGLTVRWWVGAQCSHATYSATITITGPAGVPYQAS